MKKALCLALLLALIAVSALGETVDPNTIEDTMNAENGVYEVAFISDVGDLKDKSFNEGTWNGVKLFAREHGVSYKYYIPANGIRATDDDRYNAIIAAVDGGAKVVVAAGFMQFNALDRAAREHPEVVFIFNDGWDVGLDNVLSFAFREEQCGYLAGYAVVKEGYEALGFAGGGGGTNAACCRYGYGYIQGANDAAREMGKTVRIRFSWSFGASFRARRSCSPAAARCLTRSRRPPRPTTVPWSAWTWTSRTCPPPWSPPPSRASPPAPIRCLGGSMTAAGRS